MFLLCLDSIHPPRHQLVVGDAEAGSQTADGAALEDIRVDGQ